ncbi:MAG: hypothetical protein BDTLLHRC_000176 [Candidatus Fervidibacter sp.]
MPYQKCPLMKGGAGSNLPLICPPRHLFGLGSSDCFVGLGLG